MVKHLLHLLLHRDPLPAFPLTLKSVSSLRIFLYTNICLCKITPLLLIKKIHSTLFVFKLALSWVMVLCCVSSHCKNGDNGNWMQFIGDGR